MRGSSGGLKEALRGSTGDFQGAVCPAPGSPPVRPLDVVPKQVYGTVENGYAAAWDPSRHAAAPRNTFPSQLLHSRVVSVSVGRPWVLVAASSPLRSLLTRAESSLRKLGGECFSLK